MIEENNNVRRYYKITRINRSFSPDQSLVLSDKTAIAPDKRIRRAVMLECWLAYIFKFRDRSHCQHFSQLNAPLVERIDIPNRPLGENIVFIECN